MAIRTTSTAKVNHAESFKLAMELVGYAKAATDGAAIRLQVNAARLLLGAQQARHTSKISWHHA